MLIALFLVGLLCMSFFHKPELDLVSSIRRLIEAGDLASALNNLREHIFGDPLDPIAFELLAEVLALSGDVDRARVAERRYRQLLQIAASTKAAPAVEQYRALMASRENPIDAIEIAGFTFSGLRAHESKGQFFLVGCSLDGKAFLKIEMTPFPSGGHGGFRKELEHLRVLSESDCVSFARLLDSGVLYPSDIPVTDAYQAVVQRSADSVESGYQYSVLEYIRADRGGFGVADVVLALLEQQSLGVFQNGVCLPQIRFDSIQGICRFTDYRSAISLREPEISLGPYDYIQWCCDRESERSEKGGSTSFFEGRTKEIDRLFSGKDFLLVRTQLFGRQRIADLPVPCVQDVEVSGLVLQGQVRVTDRIEILNELPVRPKERVLDLGCGAGAIGRYFASRGCIVTGIDCDQQLVRQARLLSNYARGRMTVESMDLDNAFPSGGFDTILLLALMPSISKRAQLADRLLDTGAQRIIVECAENEAGYRWQGNAYFSVDPDWKFDGGHGLKSSLQKMFPGFSVIKELGKSDSNRFVFLLEKDGGSN